LDSIKEWITKPNLPQILTKTAQQQQAQPSLQHPSKGLDSSKLEHHLVQHHLLLKTLVEKWRTETRNFHFPLDETIVTLEDVELVLGLLVDGEVVTEITIGDLVSLCGQLLGFIPPTTTVKGNAINLSWLNNTFQELSHHATDDVIAQHARAQISTLIGSLLMFDSSISKVHLMYLLLLADLNNIRNYSWGSAVMASLYRVLDHRIDFNQDNIG